MPKRKQRAQATAEKESKGRQKEQAPKRQRKSSRNQVAEKKGIEERRKLQLQDLPDNVFVQILRQMGLQRLKAVQGSPLARLLLLLYCTFGKFLRSWSLGGVRLH